MRIVFLAMVVLAAPISSAQKWWSFEGRPYYDPLITGVREAHVSALFPASFDRMAMMVEDDATRRGWDIDLGAELPLFGRETTVTAGELGKGQSGWGLWIPIDFHMIEDFGDESAPIVNTDYRFGVMLKYRRGLGDERWLALRAHYGHESTHLGDEFAINAQRHSPREFERINVSWEYLDLGAMVEWHTSHVWNVRGGVTATVPFGDSYYDTGPGSFTESRIGPVTESKNWLDPYVGVEFLDDERFAIRRVQFDVYASTEVRWRSVYDYHKADPDAAEDRQASVNVIVGVKESGSLEGFGRASPFVRYYRGVNPHGQFRNQKDFTEYGIGIRMVR